MAAAAPVRAERIGKVLALVLDAAPDNALSPAVRRGLGAALADLPPDVRAVALLSEGPDFASDGAGLAGDEDAPTLAEICAMIEELPVPVVAAVQGRASGDGAALALAAHYRLGAEGAVLVFPAATMERCPGSGATQRLPRLIGGAALAALAGGSPVSAGLFDRRVPRAGLAEAAIAFAEGAPPARPTGGRREGFADPAAFRAAVASARSEAAKSPLAAPSRIVDCAEAAMLFPLEQGLVLEAMVVEELAARPQAQALTALAAAERRCRAAARSPALPERVAIWGAEGADIARAAAVAGMQVTLIESAEATLQVALQAVAEGLAASVKAGRIAAATEAAAWARVTPALPGAPAMADLHLLTGPWAGSPLPADAGAAPVASLGPPGSAGLGILGPEGGRLAEIVEAPGAAGATVLAAFLARIGRVPVVTRGPGILAAMRGALHRAMAVETTRTGKAEVVAGVAAGLGMVRAPAVAQAEIEARLRAALANQGLKLLGSGAAARPGDIDLVLVLGGGWKRMLPGPMLWAEDRGALVLRADLARLASEAPDLYAPAPFLVQLLHDEVRIEALDG